MSRLSYTVALVVAVSISALAAEGDQKEILQQKGDLEQIQKELEQERKQLDSLKSVEAGVLKQISSFDQKIATNSKVISRLSGQLRDIQNSIADTEEEHSENEENLERSRRRYLGNIRQFYFSACESDHEFVDHPNLELELIRRVTYLSAVAGYDSGRVVQAEALLGESLEQLDDLGGRKREVSRLKQSKETSSSLEKRKKERQEKELSHLRRRKSEEADRLLMLEQAAREMQEIIDRLERQYAQRNQSRPGSSDSPFSSLKGQLLSPFKGKVTLPFGRRVDPVTKLKSFSPGITIKGRAGRTVSAVAAGTVAYSGQLRGYGNFVIINHDDQYFTTYAGLGKITVAEGEYLFSGTKLGTVATDGTIKFELRRGREALDPVEWIRIDSF
ncbi:MAG: peptidoglycan DD-metalloendopeptidase family protein [bacterium]|nr:peptidoglycan DD-metalloendopeptidase family protein [bacterium]